MKKFNYKVKQYVSQSFLPRLNPGGFCSWNWVVFNDVEKSPKEEPIKEDPNDNEFPVPRLDSPENDKLRLIPIEPNDEPGFAIEVCPTLIELNVAVAVELCFPKSTTKQENNINKLKSNVLSGRFHLDT